MNKNFNRLHSYAISRLSVLKSCVLFLAICCLAQTAITQNANKIRLGVLHINTPTGERHWQGIRDAVENHELYKTGKVVLVPHPYVDENSGFELLLDLIRREAVDIILGPTESDIFVRSFNLQEELTEFQVPVISALVTADVGNRRDGWFFRTNVNVARRVQRIYDFLNQYWISKISVLYADTEFGRRAHRALESELSISGTEGRYLPLLYDNPPNPRKQLRTILNERPEAVGFFGEREDIAQIYTQLKTMNDSGIDYNPIFFTILDARLIAEQADDIYFVSLTDSGSTSEFDGVIHMEDDVRTLGYDTALLVMDELKKLGVDRLTRDDRLLFRKQFATLLNRSGRIDKTKTGMTFSNFENTALPLVFHLKDENVEPVSVFAPVSFWQKLGHKIDLVFAIYGPWIWLSLVAAFVIAVMISRMDLRRMFPQKHVRIYRTRIPYLFLFGHFLTVVVLYVFLAETGRIHYDDILMVFIISMTPSAFLRTTFFETKQGQAIGLEKMYKKIMDAMDKMVMKARYDGLQAITNLIAYNNSEDTIREALRRVYMYHPNPTQSAHLIQKMEEKMNSEPGYLNRRRIGAELLLREFELERLKGEGLVPANWDFDHPVDPLRIVRMAARKCANDVSKVKTIQEELDKQLGVLQTNNKERYVDIKKFMDKELKVAVTVEGRLIVKLRILLVLMGFSLEWFKANGYLTDKDIEQERERLLREKERKRVSAKILRTINKRIEDKNGGNGMAEVPADKKSSGIPTSKK